MQEHLIERIRGLCARLVEIAPWWAGWWAPVSAERLRTFERTHGIALPDDYRRLLEELGERAPIPGRSGGGLLGLDVALARPMVREWLGELDQPFSGAGEQPIELEWDDEGDSYADPAPLRGCLPLLEAGDLTYLLVVTGADRGRVWSFSASRSPELRPTGATLLDWYLAELERGMAPLERQAAELAELEDRVTSEPNDLEARLALGRALLLRDRARARSLLEEAWARRESLPDDARTQLCRAIAELDLLEDRRDRVEAWARADDDWLRTYAGIATSRAGEHHRVIELLEGANIPALLRAPAVGHLAAAHAALGRVDRALELLRSTQASGSNHALAARLRTALGQRDAASRSWAEALASLDRSRTGPRPPRLSDQLELPVPSPAEIAAAIAQLQAG